MCFPSRAMKFLAYLLVFIALPHTDGNAESHYPWVEQYDDSSCIAARIPVPNGYERANLRPGSFGDWLRHLPVNKGKPPVYLFNGKKKTNQEAHFLVVNIDVGDRDLQQCADAVIRLRAEYLYSLGQYDAIKFSFTSGHQAEFRKWVKGYRPLVHGNLVEWKRIAAPDSSYASFRRYLESVFMYAGTYSLRRELAGVGDIGEIRIGDIFIQGGFPGHAVIVVDIAFHEATEKKLFLIAQSYMPAQDIHILKNPDDHELSPWYDTDFGETLHTPEWTFQATDLRRFGRVHRIGHQRP